MSKQGRNERCACGSGKKYKHCCGKQNVVAFNRDHINEQLLQIEAELLADALQNYEDVFHGLAETSEEHILFKKDQETMQMYDELTIPWVIFTFKLENNQTIYDEFLKKKLKKVKSPSIKRALEKWKQPIHSAFQLIEIDEANNQSTIQNLVTNQTYTINNAEFGEPVLNEILIATVIELDNIAQIIIGAMTLHPSNKNNVIHILDDEFNMIQNEVNVDFPYFLETVIAASQSGFQAEGADNLFWLEEAYELIAGEFIHHMREREMAPELINEALVFWNKYSQAYEPTVTKTSTYAAAVDYFISQQLPRAERLTQKQLGEMYGTTPAAISNHYQNFRARQYKLEHDQPNMAAARMETEQMLKQMTDAISGQSFNSDDELNEFINQMINSDSFNQPRADEANDLFMDAVSASGHKRTNLLEQVLAIDPDHVNAHVLLAEEANTYTAANALLDKAIQIAEKQLGKAYFVENKGHFWGLIETRPYMRALAARAGNDQATGNIKEAINRYETLLTLNPGDNQGIRDVILPLYIEAEMYDKANKLIEAYDEPSANMLFSKALIHYGITKNEIETIALVRKASRVNPYVFDYIRGVKEVPTNQIDTYSPGGESEAILYVQDNIHLWEKVRDQLFI